MATYRTPKQVEVGYQMVLGPEFGTLFYHLCNETYLLNLIWQEYTTLFGSSPSHVKLLNEAARGFFRLLEGTLWESTLLYIARLTDRVDLGVGKDNLTVKRLPALVASQIQQAVDDQLKVVLHHAKFARDWRNRRIAHRDFALALNKTLKPLNPASRARVRQAIDAINDLLNIVTGHYQKSTMVFDRVVRSGNAESLLHVLRDGLQAEQSRRKRQQAGTFLLEDVPPRAAV